MIVLVIALVVFGPKRLPQMGRQLGQALREFKSATAEVRAQVGVDEIANSVKDIKSSFSLTGSDAAAPAAVEAVAPSPEAATTPADQPADTPAPDAGAEPAEVASAQPEPVAAPTPPATISAPTPPTVLADLPVEAADPAGEGGIESFGKLKRRSAAAAHTTAD
jgi:TatA/E family protein of Tat protein translocase